MSFASTSGYTPQSIEELMLALMENLNDEYGFTYTEESFVGTNWYKFFYAAAQRLSENEVKTSEIFLYLQDYFRTTNERISRPVVTNPGLVEILEANEYIASVKAPIDADAGKVYICVDVNNSDPEYATTKLDICEIIRDSVVAGVVSQGTESETITLSNGQAFDFKYNLPNRIEVLLKLTVTTSANNQVVILSPDEVKNILLQNISERYRLGKNFEPQRYFGLTDAPWASDVLLEWSDDDGGNWHDEVYEAEYDDLFTILLENIELVEA